LLTPALPPYIMVTYTASRVRAQQSYFIFGSFRVWLLAQRRAFLRNAESFE
jgi:hypothetical protein